MNKLQIFGIIALVASVILTIALMLDAVQVPQQSELKTVTGVIKKIDRSITRNEATRITLTLENDEVFLIRDVIYLEQYDGCNLSKETFSQGKEIRISYEENGYSDFFKKGNAVWEIQSSSGIVIPFEAMQSAVSSQYQHKKKFNSIVFVAGLLMLALGSRKSILLLVR